VTDIAPTRITFNRPDLGGKEFDYIREAVEGGHTSMSGPFTGRVVELLTSWQGSEDVLLTTSCTDALEMSALLLDIEPGDTVIVPSFTFVSSALAFVRAGARLIFADIEPVTLGVDPDHVGQLMNDSVRAVVAVHYAGIGCDIDGLRSVLEAWPRAELIEDNAQGLFGTYRDEPLGSFGRFSAISFHETKNFICGEGGALVVNRPDDVDRAHVLLNKGTDRRAFMLGQVDKYSWRDIGSSFGLSDMLAAYLLAQLEERDRILAQRRGVFERYRELLTPSAQRGDLSTPVVPDDRVPAYHMFYVLLPDRVVRNKALAALEQQGIQATFHYVPLHSSDGGIRFSAYRTECPVTDDISSRLLRLPFYNDLSDGDTLRIADTLISVLR
jgi:dTDP-4-amino-4,6-dideoxygalactose transaminase